MKHGKAAGPDEIVIEMIQALDELGVDYLTKIANVIYDSGKIPQDLCKSVFIAIPKKHGAVKCELHRTISIMSHIIKVILRVIMERVRRHINPEISTSQYGFKKDNATRNAIFTLRTISERLVDLNKDVYVCFIDYTKAFDKVRHNQLFDALKHLDLDGKDLRLIRNLYWEQTAAIKVEGEIGEFVEIQRGVRQGCVLSPDLFNLYSEEIFDQTSDMKGLSIGGHNINNIRFADDTALLAESESMLQDLLDRVIEESSKKGLTVNIKKTKCMTISKKRVIPRCKIQVGDEPIEQVNSFVYLGSTITSDGKCDAEIRRRIGIAKSAFRKMDKFFKDRKIKSDIKNRILECYVHPILMYGCECWTLSPESERRLNAAEMWFHRRIQKISWTQHVSNEEVLRRCRTRRLVLQNIRERQAKFFGHVMRKGQLENIAMTGRLNGRRGRGRPRLTYIRSLSNWLQAGEVETLRETGNRERWKTMIANVRIR